MNNPNVLIILLDTASARFLSCYGYPKKSSPFIDKLASEGVRFAHCYSNGAWTPPSHASLFTGLPSIAHKMNHDHINVRTREMFHKVRNRGQIPTLASLLSENGYQTAGFCGNGWVSWKSNINYGFKFWNVLGRSEQKKTRESTPQKVRGMSNNAAFAWADTRYDSSKPYFAFINYLTPHLKRKPSEKYRKRFVKGTCPAYLHEIASRNCFGYIWNGRLKKEDIPAFEGLYAALICQTDDMIRELVRQFKKRGMMDNTIIVVCADHGDENGEHNLLDHQLCVYNTLIHVPLIVWHSSSIRRPKVEKRPVQLSDVAPTILNMVGLPQVRRKQKQMKGLDLLREVSKHKGSRPIISEHGVPRIIIRNALPDVTLEQYQPYLRRLKSIIYDGWKYIWSSDGADELYNLQRDHAETRNMIDTRPDKAGDLNKRLTRWVRSYGEELKRDERRPAL